MHEILKSLDILRYFSLEYWYAFEKVASDWGCRKCQRSLGFPGPKMSKSEVAPSSLLGLPLQAYLCPHTQYMHILCTGAHTQYTHT